ncbi:GMC family oxidoreductase [Marininema halotolerans]|uniref:Choline dehydrogenase n=1 Tax=Marininema halotolerans TaxID=1155944 RepID=A0A1I6R915_9BACL|nr:GMC family oxidoreductase [Marininema halotolerans]SFS61203.1 choline dehydrogenase [Marininema halotolerans]
MRTFDYIIIGAGTAGSILAKELTDDRRTSVLVLEAGTNLTRETKSPSIEKAVAIWSNNKFSYDIVSKIEPVVSRQLAYYSGRVIGGSSEHNAMYAVRGSRALYNEWGKLVGPQWSYPQVKSLFKKNETYIGETQSPSERGRKGPVFVRQQRNPSRLAKTFVTATSQITGAPIVEDYNTGIGECVFIKSQFTQKPVGKTFVRSSSATGYLNRKIVTQGNQFKPNEVGINRKLLILCKATANKVLMRNAGGKLTAYGVQFVQDGVSKTAYCNKEVIVCAGIWSSIILQRSGIGDKKPLLEAGIKPIVHNPNVGYNMQSHYWISMGIEVKTDQLLEVIDAEPDQPLVFGAFLNMGARTRKLQLQGSANPALLPNQDVLANNWEFNRNSPTNIMSLGLFNNAPPKSGFTLVAHSDPEAYPIVQFNALTNRNEMEFVIDSYLEVYKIIQQAKRLDPNGVYNIVYPPEDIFTIPDITEKRNTLFQYAKASLNNIYHYAGQCRMSRTIHDGVTDGFLNVFHVNRLRVADLSISPEIPDGNTCLPSMMIGLNATRIIKRYSHHTAESKGK